MKLEQCVRSIAIIAMLLGTSACGHAWVVRRGENEGVIAYKNFRSVDSRLRAMDDLVPCEYYVTSDDHTNGYSSSATVMMPVTTPTYSSGTISSPSGQSYNYSATSQQTSYVPTTIDTSDSWREVTYKCTDGHRGRSTVEHE